MNKNTNPFESPGGDANEKYGLTVTCRVPADFKRQLGNEAFARGISEGKHAATLLMSNHQKGEKANAHLDLALKENELLRKQLRLQEEVNFMYNELERREFAALKKNSDLLRKLFLADQPITKVELRNLAFDFSLATRTCIIGDQQFLVILDMCYRLEGENITITPFQP